MKHCHWERWRRQCRSCSYSPGRTRRMAGWCPRVRLRPSASRACSMRQVVAYLRVLPHADRPCRLPSASRACSMRQVVAYLRVLPHADRPCRLPSASRACSMRQVVAYLPSAPHADRPCRLPSASKACSMRQVIAPPPCLSYKIIWATSGIPAVALH